MQDKEIIQALIRKDEQVTERFFFKDCRPLFVSLIRKIFDYEVDYDEFVSEFYLYLMENDAARLRQFEGRSSIYSWVKVVARRYFIAKRDRLIDMESDELLSEKASDNEKVVDDERRVMARMDVKTLLDQMTNPRQAYVIKKLMLEDMEPDKLAEELNVKIDNLYNIKKRALAALNKIAHKQVWVANCGKSNYCCLECEKFILKRLSVDFDEYDLLATAIENEWQEEKGTALHNVGRHLENHGFGVIRKYESTADDIANALAEGSSVIAVVDGGELIGNRTSEHLEDVLIGPIPDHSVVVLSCDKDSVTIFDPDSRNSRDRYPIARFLNAWSDSNNYLVLSSRV